MADAGDSEKVGFLVTSIGPPHPIPRPDGLVAG